MKKILPLLLCVFLTELSYTQPAAKRGLLKVTDSGHYLQYEDGTPFFWLGDTAWELFHRLSLDEIKMYLHNRHDKGFNVIQAVILPEVDGLRVPNRYGQVPLIDLNPEQPNDEYFQLVDSVIAIAKDKDMVMALLPTWGDKVTAKYGGGPAVFTPENAYVYGLFLGERYGNSSNIVWVLGGDRPPQDSDDDYKPIWNAMAKGLKEGSRKNHLMTFHPGGYVWESSPYLHHAPWLDFNMNQSGHAGVNIEIWKTIRRDWDLEPPKPTIDAEPCYEDHPINPWPTWNPKDGYFRDYFVRTRLYRSVFAGGFGVTYGHHSVWQAYQPGVQKQNYAEFYWYDALDRPGAFQAGYLKRLIESRPYLERVPDDSIIVTGQGEKGEYITAFKDQKGRYMMIYLPVGKSITVDAMSINSKRVRCWWYNPKNAETKYIGKLKKENLMQFTPPALGDGNDWVLVIDDASEKYSRPGQ